MVPKKWVGVGNSMVIHFFICKFEKNVSREKKWGGGSSAPPPPFMLRPHKYRGPKYAFYLLVLVSEIM